jgi:hypothetical protein
VLPVPSRRPVAVAVAYKDGSRQRPQLPTPRPALTPAGIQPWSAPWFPDTGPNRVGSGTGGELCRNGGENLVRSIVTRL